MLQIGSFQRSSKFRVVVGHESSSVLAPGALGKRDPILRCELRELRVEPPAQDFRTLLEAAWYGQLSDIAFDPYPAVLLHDRPNDVEDAAGNSRRPASRQPT